MPKYDWLVQASQPPGLLTGTQLVTGSLDRKNAGRCRRAQGLLDAQLKPFEQSLAESGAVQNIVSYHGQETE